MNQTNKAPRLVIVDAFRGFALAGVAIVHMIENYIAGPSPQGLMEDVNGLPDQIIMGLVYFLISGKFFALFSILFGLSFSLQMETAERKKENYSFRFLWRAALLLIIGFFHQLFYRGDILTIYAMLAPFLIPFHRVNKKWILVAAGLFFLGIPRFISFLLLGNGPLFGLPEDMFNPMETAYIEAIRHGGLSEVWSQNALYGMKTKMNFQLLYVGRFYYTFGYFLFGLWLGKIGLFRKIEEYRNIIIKVLGGAGIGFLVSAVLTALAFSMVPQPVDFSKWSHVIAINLSDWINLSMTLMIICGYVLLYQNKRWEKRLATFAPYGRMALSNYILQTLIGTFLLFGWGLGLMGQIRTLYLFLIGLGVITIQMIFSKYWLDRFQYGPLEWLWRSATYFKWQAIRKKEAPVTPEDQVVEQ